MAFAPIFQSAFSATFDRRAAAAWSPSDWWTVSGKTCLAAYQAKGAPSLAASYTNLANPGTNSAAPGTAPAFASVTGWSVTKASEQYLTTGIAIPNTQAYSLLVCFANFSDGDYVALAGAWDGVGASNRFWVSPKWGANHNYANGSEGQIPGNLTGGVMGVAGNKRYLDGDAVIGDLSLPEGTNGNDLYIGTASNLGNYMTGDIIAVALYSDTLTAGEVATVSAAMAAL